MKDIDINNTILKNINIDKAILENIDIDRAVLEYIGINIDIEKEILENIDINKEISENIDIDKISYRLNLAYRTGLSEPRDVSLKPKLKLSVGGGRGQVSQNCRCTK